MLNITAKTESDTMMSRVLVTTAEVAAWPAPVALRSAWRPRKQADNPMSRPKIHD